MTTSAPASSQRHDDTSSRPDNTALSERYAEQVNVFKVHAAVFAASTLGIFAVNLLLNLTAGIAGDLSAWWSLWVLVGWGIGIAVHGLVVRLARPAPDA